jgi:hypothetical protein
VLQIRAPPAALCRPTPLTPFPALSVVLVCRVFPSQTFAITMQIKTAIFIFIALAIAPASGSNYNFTVADYSDASCKTRNKSPVLTAMFGECTPTVWAFGDDDDDRNAYIVVSGTCAGGTMSFFDGPGSAQCTPASLVGTSNWTAAMVFSCDQKLPTMWERASCSNTMHNATTSHFP